MITRSGTGARTGILAKAERTSDQTGLSTTEQDLSPLTFTITVPAGRQIRLKFLAWMQVALVSQTMTVRIKEGATVLQVTTVTTPSAAGLSVIPCEIVFSPSAGAHTYKVTAATSSGSGVLAGGATYPAQFTAEDVGPA